MALAGLKTKPSKHTQQMEKGVLRDPLVQEPRTGTETSKILVFPQFTQGNAVETEIGTPKSLEILLRAGPIH